MSRCRAALPPSWVCCASRKALKMPSDSPVLACSQRPGQSRHAEFYCRGLIWAYQGQRLQLQRANFLEHKLQSLHGLHQPSVRVLRLQPKLFVLQIRTLSVLAGDSRVTAGAASSVTRLVISTGACWRRRREREHSEST